VLEALADAADAASEPEIHILIAGDGLNDYADDPKFETRHRAARGDPLGVQAARTPPSDPQSLDWIPLAP